MNIGILVIGNNESLNFFDISRMSKLLSERGFEVKKALYVLDTFNYEENLAFLKQDMNAILVCGNTANFLEKLNTFYETPEGVNIFELDEVFYALIKEYDEKFILNFVIPALNSKCKTFYTTSIFKTFGKTEEELRQILKDNIKNRNRIAFKFIPSLNECEVQIKYSSKTSKTVVDEMVISVTEKLHEFTYATTDISLEEQVAQFLIYHNKTLSIAESFTGGGIAASLVNYPGISACLKEGLVCYSNDSKIKRLNVETQIISNLGAVSIETVYEMAANLLQQNETDYVVATSGNAGPTAEKEGDAGLCFIAVGNKRGIHIYKYNFTGNRKEVITKGVKTALFMLYKKLSENEFMQILNEEMILRKENEKE